MYLSSIFTASIQLCNSLFEKVNSATFLLKSRLITLYLIVGIQKRILLSGYKPSFLNTRNFKISSLYPLKN